MRGAPSPYAGQEARAVKALSPEEVEALLAGRGAGLARVAELNHYPGPAHVLELSAPLALARPQVEATKAVHERMRQEALRLGAAIVEKERALDRLFAEQRIDARQLRALVSEIGALQGALRAVHLAAHIETKQILSPRQVERYDELRGYAAGGGGDPHAGHGQPAH